MADPTPATIDGHPVRPALAVIPLMTTGELEGLAADIRHNGLYQPITLEGEVLIDGRCRLIACRMAEVEPRFAQLPEGADAVDWIYSRNFLRSHGFARPARKALATVLLARKLGDPEWCFVGIHPDLLEQARAVVAEDPQSVSLVLSGARQLEDVYQEILRRRTEAARRKRQWAMLQAEAPSIADLVVGDHLTLEEAVALHRRRRRAARPG